MIQTLNVVSEYKEELIYPAICRAFESLNIAKDMRPDLKVAIKPNLILAKSPNVPVTTHPLVIKAVVRRLNEHGVTDITLAESFGGPYNYVSVAENVPKAVRLILLRLRTAKLYSKRKAAFPASVVRKCAP